MKSILTVIAAVLLLQNALSGAVAAGSASSPGLLMVALPSFGFIYVLLTFYRASQATR